MLTNTQIYRIREMKAKGYNIREIGLATGISFGIVRGVYNGSTYRNRHPEKAMLDYERRVEEYLHRGENKDAK